VLSAGTTLGSYQIVAPIGAGGMGEVYRARDTKLNRDVALKILPETFASDPDRLARFTREAQTLAALNHPNIAAIYGLEESGGVRALVMELVEGDDLSQRIARGAIPLDEALPIAKQIADALEAAHEQGIVHRDLKPANIKVRADGTVKVLDFGLAKAMEPVAGSSPGMSMSPTLSLHATMAGVILGTAAYMSPEQARGRPVDKRTDIWAFGAVLYEMLAGARAFDGDDVTEIIAAVVKTTPNWSALPADTPRPIVVLIQRCLEKDRTSRIGDISAARFLLADHATLGVAPTGAPPSAPLPHSAGSRTLPWVSSAAALVFAIAWLVVWAPWRAEKPVERQLLQYTVASPDKVKNIQHIAVSPDGHYVVMQASGDGGQQLWVRSLDSLQTQPLAGTENASLPFWSPDSRDIGFFTSTQLKKISVTGGPSQALCDAPNSRGGTWSRDGAIVFAPGNGIGGLSRVAAAGGVPVPLTKNESGGTHRWPMFLPDGRRVLYLANGGNANGIHLASLDSTDDRRLVLDESNPQYVPPSPGNPFGHLLFVRQQTLMAQPVDSQSLDPKGDLFPVAERVSRGQSNGHNLYSVSGNGILIFQAGGGGAEIQHVWFDRSGKDIGTVGTLVRSRNSIALSPDGKRVVVERAENQGPSDLWITDMERSGSETRLTFDASVNVSPVWSPDGSKVAFGSNRKAGNLTLYQRASNGTGQDERLFESKDVNVPTDWSRDGRFLVFASTSVDGKTREDLWALPVTGGATPGKQGDKKPILLLRTDYAETQGQLSPDSRWLAYTSNESGTFQVYVQPFAPGWDTPITGKWQISTTGGTQPRWRGDGKELFYLATDRKLMTVDVKATAQSFDRGTPQALFDSRSSVGPLSNLNWGYVPSADGKRFLMPVLPGALGATPPLTVVVNWLAGVKK
jgi:serine/threonine protein kinase